MLADEANFANCSQGLRHTWLFDVREPTNPVSFATMPVPSEADYCAKGGNFGPHNLWENRPGAFQSSRFVFATYHNAGVRVFDIEKSVAMLAEHQLSAGSNAKNDDMASARQVRPRCPYPALPRYSGVGDPAMAGDPGIITAALIENQVRT